MASTLVETISINYEDFSQSFLTCPTCVGAYDTADHAPKLLACSHTVCHSCLEHIVQASAVDTPTIRCPICREMIAVPRGGVASFPPSFIVNQLLDMMGRQRRNVIQKCSLHAQTELMFCETCDVVFCIECTGESHSRTANATEHTIIPFSIAFKRMSEILLYKANTCIKNLNEATQVVTDEISKLDVTADKCIEAAVRAFEEAAGVMAQRQQEVIDLVRRIRDNKKHVLRDQLDLIEMEKSRVEADCQEIQQRVEARNITAKLGNLDMMLESSTTLLEPRENSFMRFEWRHNSAIDEIINALRSFGKIVISDTCPARCTVTAIATATTHLKTSVIITAVDYHGNVKRVGGDLVTVSLIDDRRNTHPVCPIDNNDGTYTVTFTPRITGMHRLAINVFDRPVKNSPLAIEVNDHINPIAKVGTTGTGEQNFKQPINIARSHGLVFVLDVSNGRVKVMDDSLSVIRHIVSCPGLEQHSATGLAINAAGNLVVTNWRMKEVTELTPDGTTVVRRIASAQFIEPIAVAVNCHGDIIVADNGVGKLLLFDAGGTLNLTVGCKGDKPGQFKLINAVYSCRNDEIIVCDNRLQVFSRTGQYLREISAPATSGAAPGGTYGGVCIDADGRYLATRVEKGRSVVQVFSAAREWLFDIDSFGDKLKRPSGIVTDDAGHVYVVDLGNDCVKKYRYI